MIAGLLTEVLILASADNVFVLFDGNYNVL